LGYDSLFDLYLEQKLPGFGDVVSILRDPPAKLKTTHYYPVTTTHITDKKLPTNALVIRKMARKMQDRYRVVLATY